MCVLLSVLGITLSMQGTLRALQLQKPASQVLLASLYLCSLPVAYVYSIEMERGIMGLWLGYSTGQFIIMFLYGTLLWQADW